MRMFIKVLEQGWFTGMCFFARRPCEKILAFIGVVGTKLVCQMKIEHPSQFAMGARMDQTPAVGGFFVVGGEYEGRGTATQNVILARAVKPPRAFSTLTRFTRM